MQAQKKPFFPFALSSAPQVTSIASAIGTSRVLTAVSNDPLPIDQQLANAFNANNAVMAYVLGIGNTQLPTISPSPTWYSTFQTAFSDAQIHANGWYPIAANLVSIPNSIAGYGISFNVSMSTINSLVAVLQNDPTNAAAIAALKTQFTSMISQITSYTNSAVTVQQSITTFSNNLTSDAAVLAQAVIDSTKEQAVDQAKIATFKADIASLQSEISHWQTVETATAIAAGVAFFAGAVIAIFSFGIGLAFGIVAAAALITTMVIASNKIQALKSQVEADNSNMNAVTQQAASLAVLNDQVTGLIALSQAAGTQIALVLQVWQELESELNAVVTDLNNCNGNVTNLNLPQLQLNLNSANQDWQALVGLCNTIASIKYNQATPATATIPNPATT
ncbi:HBL/NHE enterotoxin family protein [Xanthomonas campestris pv. campestris]|nr:HBL/NHE enterotoxin family protein [Xanthomonas campestris pv. campestris]